MALKDQKQKKFKSAFAGEAKLTEYLYFAQKAD